jgi:hypothetical protein
MEFVMLKLFTDHPATVGESYLEHLMFAVGFGSRMLAGGMACCIHGALPFLFLKTGSSIVLELHAVLMCKRATLISKPLSASPRGGSEPEYAI